MTISLLPLLMTLVLVFQPEAQGHCYRPYRDGRLAGLRKQLGNLQCMNNQLKAAVNALERKLKTTNDNWKSTVSAVEGRLQARDNNLQSAVNALQGNFQAMNTRISVLEQRVDFLATFAAKTPLVVPGGVVFNLVLANNGGGYNPHTGVFTAPRRGFYVFTAQAYVRGNGHAFWDLMVNGQLRIRSKHFTEDDSSFQFLYPVQLQAGDRVSISNINHVNLWGNYHSFFGGWLI